MTKETSARPFFLGLRTVIYHVRDMDAAKAWYEKALGIKPYFDQPFYVGFNIGGYELGLDPDLTGVIEGHSAVAYWGVDDAHASFQKLISLGAKEYRNIQDVGEGILVGSVMDPFNNVFGIIQNPHFNIEE